MPAADTTVQKRSRGAAFKHIEGLGSVASREVRHLHKYLCYLTWQEDLERAHTYNPLVIDYYSDTIYRKSEIRGIGVIKAIERTVVEYFFPLGRFVFQEELHNQMLRATLRQTLGNDYNALFGQVCKLRGWDSPKKNLFTIASRRSGKTTGMASMIAALLIHIPNIQIVVYSVALRTAQEFVRLVAQYIQMHPNGKAMLKRADASETLELYGPSPGDKRRIRSFPSGGNAKNVSAPGGRPQHIHISTQFFV